MHSYYLQTRMSEGGKCVEQNKRSHTGRGGGGRREQCSDTKQRKKKEKKIHKQKLLHIFFF